MVILKKSSVTYMYNNTVTFFIIERKNHFAIIPLSSLEHSLEWKSAEFFHQIDNM
jgi:hypothetical protein